MYCAATEGRAPPDLITEVAGAPASIVAAGDHAMTDRCGTCSGQELTRGRGRWHAADGAGLDYRSIDGAVSGACRRPDFSQVRDRFDPASASAALSSPPSAERDAGPWPCRTYLAVAGWRDLDHDAYGGAARHRRCGPVTGHGGGRVQAVPAAETALVPGLPDAPGFLNKNGVMR